MDADKARRIAEVVLTKAVRIGVREFIIPVLIGAIPIIGSFADVAEAASEIADIVSDADIT
jgi:hypothetical protein